MANALLGSWLVSIQGRATFDQVQSEFGAGQLPGASIAHGAMILIAGAFLLTPGLMTDAVGFMLLIPAIREGIRRWLVARYADRWIIVP